MHEIGLKLDFFLMHLVMITADKSTNKYNDSSKLTSFEQWMPLRDHSLGASHGVIPVILLLMTA